MNSWWEIFSVFLLSTVKFVFGSVPWALGLGFSFFKATTVTSLGGFTGVLFFVFSSDKIITNYKNRQKQKRLNERKLICKKVFTRTNKFIVRIKKRFGLAGISFFTPLLFSIPVGCFIAVRYFKNKQQIIIYMFSSILFWSIAGYYLYKPIINAIRTHFF